jgi:hypothetical protein
MLISGVMVSGVSIGYSNWDPPDIPDMPRDVAEEFALRNFVGFRDGQPVYCIDPELLTLTKAVYIRGNHSWWLTYAIRKPGFEKNMLNMDVDSRGEGGFWPDMEGAPNEVLGDILERCEGM